MANTTVSTLLVRPLALALASSPAGLQAFYAACDVTPQRLADVDARITPTQLRLAWTEAVRLTGEPALALRIAAATPTGAFGIVEYLCRTAPTLGDALRQWVRYLNLLNDSVDVELLVQDDQHACVRVVTDSDDPSPMAHELCFAMLLAQARMLSTTPFRATCIEFTHRAPADVAPYRKWFDAPVKFGAPHTQLVLPRGALASTLVTADAALAAILGKHIEDVHHRAPAGPPLTAQVRRILGTALRNDDAGVDSIARVLGLTSRSLQRRLKDEGSSFQILRDEIRRELADRYLEDDLSISEISFLLGFSEPSAFFRAFKRWTGLTPIEHRTHRRTLAPV